MITPDYAKRLFILAPRERAFDAVATILGIRGWWTPLVSGSSAVGDEFRLGFEGLDEYIRLRVDRADRPDAVEWTCLEHSALPEWTGTVLQFRFTEVLDWGSYLMFRHKGLTARVNSYTHSVFGWELFLISFASYVETGLGAPYRDALKRESVNAED